MFHDHDQVRLLNPEWQLLEPYFAPLKDVKSIPIQDVRKGLYGLIQTFNETIPTITEGLTVQESKFTVEDGTIIKIRVYIPHTTSVEEKTGFPLLCWHFGGGFCAGALDDDDKRLRRLATKLRITCTSVAYRLAPEHPYPVPLNDAFSALKWVLLNASTFSINLRKGFLVGGFSAGANLTCTLVQRILKDDSIQPKVTGQVLINPALINPLAIPDKWKNEFFSLQECAEDCPVISTVTLQFFYNIYAGTNPVNLSNTEVSPLLIPSLADTAPTYIQICDFDPVRDDGVLYNKLLLEAGVPTKVDTYPNLPHGFHTFTPQFSKSWEQDKDFHEGIAWLLNVKQICRK